MRKFQLLIISGLLSLIFIINLSVVMAVCNPSDIGTNGDDTIVCTDSDFQAYGNDGNDTITNEGNLYNGAFGGNGNDTITNNGDTPELNGQDGNDTIVNAGTVDNIYGGADDDMVTVGDSPDTALTVYGDSGNGNIGGTNDVLRFEYTMGNASDHTIASAAIAAANAAGGTITINGQQVTFAEFEQLIDALIQGYSVTVSVDVSVSALPEYIVQDGRVNADEAGWSSAVPYCSGGGVQVYAADGNLKLESSAGQVQNALTTAINSGTNQTIAAADGYGLYALFSNQLQLIAPDGYSYVFAGDTCA